MLKYSIVIPIKRFTYFWSKEGHIDQRPNTHLHDNIIRFFEISWKTHDKHFKKSDIDCIYFIISSEDKPYFTQFVSKHIHNVRTKIIIEDHMLSPMYNFTSHRKQMLLKLLIWKYIKTEYYLILDDDIISLKPFGYNDLFSATNNKKIRYAAEPSIESQPHAWEGSRDLLKIKKRTNIYKLKNTISITPEILITSVVKDMMEYLEHEYGNVHVLYNEMVKLSWTEYVLYWLYLRYIDKKGVSYYENDSLTSLDTNLTLYEDNYRDIIQKNITEHIRPFMIIQSNVYEYNIKDLKNALNLK